MTDRPKTWVEFVGGEYDGRRMEMLEPLPPVFKTPAAAPLPPIMALPDPFGMSAFIESDTWILDRSVGAIPRYRLQPRRAKC